MAGRPIDPAESERVWHEADDQEFIAYMVEHWPADWPQSVYERGLTIVRQVGLRWASRHPDRPRMTDDEVTEVCAMVEVAIALHDEGLA